MGQEADCQGLGFDPVRSTSAGHRDLVQPTDLLQFWDTEGVCMLVNIACTRYHIRPIRYEDRRCWTLDACLTTHRLRYNTCSKEVPGLVKMSVLIVAW
jgi:hypothetical protein